jgi:non-ribosomal peptide synthetase component E (peptide arylation enzyme)
VPLAQNGELLARHSALGCGQALGSLAPGLVLLLVESGRVRVAQRPQAAAGRGGGGEAVTAERVEVAVLERGEPGDVLVADFVALNTKLSGCCSCAARCQFTALCNTLYELVHGWQ